jgi:hypothetical protein
MKRSPATKFGTPLNARRLRMERACVPVVREFVRLLLNEKKN